MKRKIVTSTLLVLSVVFLFACNNKGSEKLSKVDNIISKAEQQLQTANTPSAVKSIMNSALSELNQADKDFGWETKADETIAKRTAFFTKCDEKLEEMGEYQGSWRYTQSMYMCARNEKLIDNATDCEQIIKAKKMFVFEVTELSKQLRNQPQMSDKESKKFQTYYDNLNQKCNNKMLQYCGQIYNF